MAFPRVFTKQLGAASVNSIAGSQSPGAGAITLTAASVTIDTATAANSQIGRRVILTSGGNDTGITFTVKGTSASGAPISDSFAGASGGAAQSNLDFVTVNGITHTGSVASTIEAGTNGVGSSPWMPLNWAATSVMNIGYAVELVSGACNFSIQHTYDDPNNLLGGALYPFPFDSPVVAGASSSADGAYTTPIAAIRVLINSGTGEIRVRVLQSSIG